MSARADKLQRILVVQQQLHRIEEWKARDLQRQIEELEEAQTSIIAALNSNDALQGLFIDAMARRLRSLAEAGQQAARAQASQAQQLLESASRLACAERLAEVADGEAIRETTRAALIEVIERHVGPATQASRKIDAR